MTVSSGAPNLVNERFGSREGVGREDLGRLGVIDQGRVFGKA